ncbi:MAG: alpha/beta fold hydrolase [Rubrobacteraceae bacterium]
MNDERLQALLSVPRLSAPKVSPDGRRVAWSWSQPGPAAEVFGATTDGAGSPVRLTASPEDTLVVSWTPDSRAVIVGQDRDGDERVRLFRVKLERPGVMEPLTDESPDYYIRGGQLHPNERWLVYGANLDPATGREIEATWILRHDLATGERKVLAKPRRANFFQPLLNAPGSHVLYSRNDRDPAGRQAWLVDVEGREDREILNFGPQTKVAASWYPAGNKVLFVAETEQLRRLGVWCLENESVTWLLEDPGRDLEYAFVPPNGGPAVAVEIEDAGLKAFLLDVGRERSLPQPPGNLVPLAPTEDEGWLGFHYSARRPPDLVLLDPQTGGHESLTGLPHLSTLDLDSLVSAEDFSWKSVDGLEIRGWLYRVRDSIGTVVLIHGGPASHAEDRFNAQIQYLVSSGFSVLAPNYRGSTGYGVAFRESIKEDGWGGREQEDIRTGIEALIRAGVARRGRVGVTGTSYGGYSAWWQITHYPPELVAAAAPICGMTDLVVDYYATRPDLRPYSEEMMGGTPDEVPEIYHDRSPIHSVGNIRGKLLIVQGLKDPNVPYDNVEAVVKVLEQESISYELLTFEDEGHGIVRPENLKILYPRLADFFAGAFTTEP